MTNRVVKITIVKVMRFAFALTGALFAVWGVAGTPTPTATARNPDVMIVGYNSVPPDSMHVLGEALGPTNDLLRDVAREMGVKEVKFRYMPLARLLEELKNNNIDCINSIGSAGDPTFKINANRPFLSTMPGLLVRKEMAVDETVKIEQLKGLTIGTKIKMSLTATMQKTDVFKIIWIQGDDAIEDAVKMLAKGRIDAVYSPRVGELIYFATKHAFMTNMKAVKLPDPAWDVFVAFSRDGTKRFKARYDSALENVLLRKGYDAYLNEYLMREAGLAAVAPEIRKFILPR